MTKKERFRVTGKIAKLLGRESLSDPVTALYEVIKNSHDADALKAYVKIDHSKEEGKIIIKETKGDGMTYEDIRDKFLVIGTYAKQPSGSRTRKTRRLKRLMLGQKGVGRFALERLGREVKIISKPYGTEDKLTFSIDWDRFEPESVTVDMIPIRIKEEKRSDKEDSGLEIEISKLRDDWTAFKVREFIEYLKSFVLPPHLQRSDSFNIELEAPSFGIEKRIIEPELAEKAFYTLEMAYDKGSDHFTVSAEKMGRSYIRRQKKKSFRSHFSGEIRNVSELKCGPVRLYVYYFPVFSKREKYPILEDEYYKKAQEYYSHEFHENIPRLLNNNHGVKIYRGGLREFRYGDPENDWLDRSTISRNMSGTMQANRIIGFCILPDNPQIVATANRREAVQNQEFYDLRDVVVASMKILDNQIHEDREELIRKAKEEQQKFVEQLEEETKESQTDSPTEKSLRHSLSRAQKYLQDDIHYEEAQTTIREIELAHAVVGHFISKLYHDFVGTSSEIIGTEIVKLEEHVKGISPKTAQQLERIVEKLSQKWNEIRVIFDALENIESGLGVEHYYKREKIDIPVKDEVERIFTDLTEVTRFENVEIKNKINRNLEIWTYGPIFYSITYNLLSNSIKALMKSKPKDRENIIFVKSEIEGKYLKLIFADNSTHPIPKDRWETVFEPWISTTSKFEIKNFKGKGIGLSICKEILKFARGSIAIEDPILDGQGTTIVVRLPRGIVNPSSS